jgi:lipopolysaccharide/colanic/teichoic acid biosynthesis glycosyltransferase
MIIRILDILFSIVGLLLCSPVFLLLYILGLIDTGEPVFRQERLGKDLRPFVLIKFRTMKLGTESCASHLVSSTAVTKLGSILRRTKLDELPQLLNVLRGDMSFVGPRPGLGSQTELTNARILQGVYSVRPGITGLAQVNRIDMATPDLLARTDALMLRNFGIKMYLKYILITLLGKGWGDSVR